MEISAASMNASSAKSSARRDKGITIEQKPEVRKAGGVYYTPRYIVDYIVEQTAGKLLDEIGMGGQLRVPAQTLSQTEDGAHGVTRPYRLKTSRNARRAASAGSRVRFRLLPHPRLRARVRTLAKTPDC